MRSHSVPRVNRFIILIRSKRSAAKPAPQPAEAAAAPAPSDAEAQAWQQKNETFFASLLKLLQTEKYLQVRRCPLSALLHASVG